MLRLKALILLVFYGELLALSLLLLALLIDPDFLSDLLLCISGGLSSTLFDYWESERFEFYTDPAGEVPPGDS